MENKKLTTEGFLEVVQGSAEAVCDSFTDPDDDFMPTMHIMGKEMIVCGFDGRFLRDSHTKDILAEQMMVPLILGTGAKMIATVFSSWALDLDGLSEDEARAAFERANREGLENHPNRREQIILTVVTEDSAISLMREIVRDGVHPPILAGDWEKWGGGEGETVDGRFVGPLMKALKKSTGEPDPEFMQAVQASFGIDA